VTGFRVGVRIGVDVGRARIGVARCDRDGLLAVPIETVPRDDDSVARIHALCVEYEAIELVVGLPVSLAGSDTESTVDAREFASKLAHATRTPTRLVDERLSTVTANDALRRSGRSQRTSRNIVDQVAAVVLLQHAIDTEKSTGTPPGVLIHLDEE
jgi:putative Holliday junction resolvase